MSETTLFPIIPKNTGKIDVFMVDPPWKKRKGGIRKSRPLQGREFTYETMETDDIFRLLDVDIFPLSTDNHTVFMWTIDTYLHECECRMDERGYKLHARFVWDKENGVAPCFSVRFSHEYLLWFYKPKFIPVAKNVRGVYTTIIREKSREHSRKPDAAYDMVSKMFPYAIKMDVFSREKRDGWLQYGNEINFFKN